MVKKKDARPFKIQKKKNIVLVDAETGMKADIKTKKVIYEYFKTKDNFKVILEKLPNKDLKLNKKKISKIKNIDLHGLIYITHNNCFVIILLHA